MIIFHLFLGWFIADFLSGLFHWLEDRVFWVGMPFISASIVEPNRLHHNDPMAMTRETFISRNGTTWAAVTMVAALWFLLAGFSWIWLGAVLGGAVVTQVHYLAHKGHSDGLISVLQQVGIIQSRSHHWQHHKEPQDRHYCILTNFLNPWLDWMGFWLGLERLLTIIGLEPNRGAK